jgi:GTP-binding protein
LLDKERLLAITKCDLLDDELMTELKEEFPKDIKTICISSVSQTGILKLKDEVWKMIHNGLDK